MIHLFKTLQNHLFPSFIEININEDENSFEVSTHQVTNISISSLDAITNQLEMFVSVSREYRRWKIDKTKPMLLTTRTHRHTHSHTHPLTQNAHYGFPLANRLSFCVTISQYPCECDRKKRRQLNETDWIENIFAFCHRDKCFRISLQ